MLSRLLKTNEHPVERFVRVVLGIGILSLYFVGPHSAWALLGVIPLLTGIVGSCPIYSIFGISTCAVPKKPVARPSE